MLPAAQVCGFSGHTVKGLVTLNNPQGFEWQSWESFPGNRSAICCLSFCISVGQLNSSPQRPTRTSSAPTAHLVSDSPLTSMILLAFLCYYNWTLTTFQAVIDIIDINLQLNKIAS